MSKVDGIIAHVSDGTEKLISTIDQWLALASKQSGGTFFKDPTAAMRHAAHAKAALGEVAKAVADSHSYDKKNDTTQGAPEEQASTSTRMNMG